MKKLIIAFLLAFILFFVSCGMPSYHDFTDAIHVSTTSTSNTEYDAGFRVTFSDSIFDYYFDTASPSVLLMYSIADGSGTLSNSFNSAIRNSGNYYNGMPATFNNESGQLENVESTLDSKKIYLYKFTSADNGVLADDVSSPPDYTFSQLNTAHDYYFMIKRVTVESSDNNQFRLELDVYQDSISDSNIVDSIPLYRNNTSILSPFFNNIGDASGNDYSFYSDLTVSSYQIHLYLAVNVVPAASSSFSNIYWSSLVRDSIAITI